MHRFVTSGPTLTTTSLAVEVSTLRLSDLSCCARLDWQVNVLPALVVGLCLIIVDYVHPPCVFYCQAHTISRDCVQQSPPFIDSPRDMRVTWA